MKIASLLLALKDVGRNFGKRGQITKNRKRGVCGMSVVLLQVIHFDE